MDLVSALTTDLQCSGALYVVHSEVGHRSSLGRSTSFDSTRMSLSFLVESLWYRVLLPVLPSQGLTYKLLLTKDETNDQGYEVLATVPSDTVSGNRRTMGEPLAPLPPSPSHLPKKPTPAEEGAWKRLETPTRHQAGITSCLEPATCGAGGGLG